MLRCTVLCYAVLPSVGASTGQVGDLAEANMGVGVRGRVRGRVREPAQPFP
jgi:hypothetical protein